MAIAGARKARVLRDRISAFALLLALLILTLASDRLHNHSGVEEVFIASSTSGPALAREASATQSRKPLVCVACLHHRTYGMSSSDKLAAGPMVSLPEAPPALALVPPPAPLTRPAGLRAPPLA